MANHTPEEETIREMIARIQGEVAMLGFSIPPETQALLDQLERRAIESYCSLFHDWEYEIQMAIVAHTDRYLGNEFPSTALPDTPEQLRRYQRREREVFAICDALAEEYDPRETNDDVWDAMLTEKLHQLGEIGRAHSERLRQEEAAREYEAQRGGEVRGEEEDLLASWIERLQIQAEPQDPQIGQYQSMGDAMELDE